MSENEDMPVTAEGSETVIVEKPGLWQRAKVRLLKTVVGLVLGVGALAALVIFGIDTGPGHRFVAEQIAGLRFENGMRIKVGRIEGSLYGAMTLHDLSVYDTKGEFLFSPEIHVDWRPFSYLSNHVDVRSATAQRIVLRRSPVFNETPPSEGPLLPDLDIDIGNLKVDRFVAEAAVAGEQRVMNFAGQVHISDGRAKIVANGGTLALEGKPGGDRFTAELDAVPDENRLTINLDLDAPSDGVIAALAGLTQPLSARLSGRGDWKAWNGSLDMDLGDNELARLALGARNGVFTIKGPTRIAQMFTAQTAALLGPRTDIDLTAALAERRMTLSGLVSSDAFRLTPDGTIDLSDNSFDTVKVAFELTKPSVLAENLSGAGLRADVALDGAFAAPSVDYVIAARRIVMNGMGLEDLSASGAAKVDAERIMIPLNARVARITGLDVAAGGTLRDVRLNGNLAIQGTRILSDDMRLRSDRIDAGLLLVADMSEGIYSGAIDGKIDNYQLASVGIFNISTDMKLNGTSSGYGLEGNVRARSTRLTNESVASYLGGNFSASTFVRYGADGVVRFSNLRLAAPDLAVNGGSGLWAPDGRIALNADGTSDRYGAITVRVKGTIDNPDAHVLAERPDLGIGLANLDARVTGAPGGYRLDLTSDTDYGPLQADVVLGMGQTMSLSINSANLSGIAFTGQLQQVPAGPFTGQLRANGNGLGGLIDLSAEGKYQVADFHVRAQNTVFQGNAGLAIGSAIVDGRAVLYDQPQIVADAEMTGVQLGEFNLAAARAQIDYREGKGRAKALVEGISSVPFRLGINAEMQPELWRVALRGRVRGQTLQTKSPARIVVKDGEYELLPTAIGIGSGTARVAGSYGAGMKLQSRIEGIDMAMVNAFVPGSGIGGKASGSIDWEQTGPEAFPRADARLKLTNFTRTSAAVVSQPVDVSFVGKLLSDGGEARAVIRRRGTVIGRLVASLRPLPPGNGSWSQRLLEAPLGGGIRFNGPAETLFSFAGQAGQTLTGPVGLAADFSCRVSDPCLTGVVKGNGLRYENQAFGTRLSNMNFSGTFSGDRLELQSLTANAGDGTVKANGTVSLAKDQGYPMDISVELQNARLARSDAVSASATGKLNLSKKQGELALLSGDIRLPETRYQIVLQGAAEVPQLTGVRFKPRLGPQRVTGDEEAEAITGMFANLRLQLRLRAPEKLYVSGMGLESEWGADFTVFGTSSAPQMKGQVDLKRGTLGFAGRSFEITKGLVTFNGGPTIDPSVSIVATEQIEDVDVTVEVGGRAMDPQITFNSSPALPDDEVLSRILFGSSIANLSAIQAVQLASSLNSLRATGGGLNPLGKLRSATGIDRLRILGADDTTGRGTALAAGQYLTDDIYVELITDARGFTATQLEVSVTRWLSVLSQAGGSGVNSVNVRIKKDY